MDIAGIIKRLLYRHDCVIIPGFGALVTEYAPAEIHPTQHIFLPPHKSIAFNRSLKTNDGLLISAIATEENLNYEAATLQLRQFVRDTENSLKNKGGVMLPFIGKFHFDIEKNLLFEAEQQQNYLLPAYGLDRFIAHPVMRREEALSALETTIVQARKKRRMNWIGFGVILAILALSAQVILISTDSNILKSQKTGLMGFMSQLFNSPPKASTPAPAITENTHRKDTLIQIVIFQNQSQKGVDTNAIIANAIHPDSTKAPEAITVKEAPAVVEPTAYPEGSYYLIFGCFKGKKACQVLIDLLKEKGINTSIVIEDSYRRIGIGGFATENDAVNEMHAYRDKGVKDIWVMKK